MRNLWDGLKSADETMERLNENLRQLRDMRERLSAMLERVKADDELRTAASSYM
jgi:prefoldin subunit 5